MLDLGQNSGPKPRCLVTNIKLSKYIDHDTPPTKKKPFSIILSQTFSHSLELLLPSPAAEALQKTFSFTGHGTLHYAKVHMKLLDIISGDFFTTYIKTPGSNILMLSEGRPGIDRVFKLQDGVLRLEVDKATFQSMGLEGKAIASEGRKHVKQRYRSEIDLRSPSMLHGKKGFERVVWACKNVLVEMVTWLFVDCTGGEKIGEGPVKEHVPSVRRVEANIEKMEDVLVPTWPGQVSEEDYEEAEELLEWIGLAMLSSSILTAQKDTNAYLCRYQVPSSFGEPKPQHVVRLRWSGLVHPSFAQKVFLAALKAIGEEHWLTMSATAFDGEAYTILVDEGATTVWQYKD